MVRHGNMIFNVGDRVFHNNHGTGTIKKFNIHPDKTKISASVEFDKAPLKKKGGKSLAAIHVSALSIITENMSGKSNSTLMIDELVNKNMINDDASAGLKNMIDSPDRESTVTAKEIIGLKIEDKLKEGLNDDQVVAFTEILNFLNDPKDNAFVLKGYAGTGKTFLVSRIIEYISCNFPDRLIAITAPTNKAVRVLQATAPYRKDGEKVFTDLFTSSNKITYSTIHKLLGLREMITKNGNQIFKANSKKTPEIEKYKYLIVDETSMLDDSLCRDIMAYDNRIKIIFMGDPAQIPPVNRVDCIPFRGDPAYTFARAELQKIMRQKGDHPIVDASFLIRNNLAVKNPIPVLKTIINDKGHGIVYFNSKTDRTQIRGLLTEYFVNPKFKENTDFIKVIAWRNVVVTNMNKIIRELLYGKAAPTYVVGERLIANGPIFKEVDTKWGKGSTIVLNTSEEMEIEKVNITVHSFREKDYFMDAKVYECVVKTIRLDDVIIRNTIHIMHEDSLVEYNKMIALAKASAIRAGGSALWIIYYNILKWNDDIAYNYAITAHKSQGSTYTNVLLIEEDLDLNRKNVERNRIKYTAYSRATDQLFILRDNYGN